MTLFSWLYMLAVWAAIVALNVFCFARIFSKRNRPPNHGEQPPGDGEET